MVVGEDKNKVSNIVRSVETNQFNTLAVIADIIALVILIYSWFIIVMMQINTIQYTVQSYKLCERRACA